MWSGDDVIGCNKTHYVRSGSILLFLILVLVEWNGDVYIHKGRRKVEDLRLTPRKMAMLDIFFFEMPVNSTAGPS